MPDVIVEDAAGVTRVLVGNIGTAAAPDYGIRVTAPDGTTVIIDGTSNVFKIQASGTQSVAYPAGAGAGNTTTTTLSGVTSGSQMLRALCDVASYAGALAFGQGRFEAIEIVPDLTGANIQYYAYSSFYGGAPTDIIIKLGAISGSVIMNGVIAYQRYYLLKEASI